jgi:Rrp15p
LTEKKEMIAKKTFESEKREHEEVRRVMDVIGGWGGENERSLRKVA